MPELLGDLITHQAEGRPDAPALLYKDQVLSYQALAEQVQTCQGQLAELALSPGERVAVYLPKVPEAVIGMFASAALGAVFVPVNPLLKPQQVAYILNDCNVRVLITSTDRHQLLAPVLGHCHDLHWVITTGSQHTQHTVDHYQLLPWQTAAAPPSRPAVPAPVIDQDIAAILYTSGSTGNPKGVVLSHRNMLAGARSVASYLANQANDRLLAVLPFSFDYGLSQLTCAFHSGASVVLMDYLLPRDVIRAISRYGVTGLAAVPPLWNQLAELDWPAEAQASLRYITNSGGAMPVATTTKLRKVLPNTAIYLMYGLTEAFRSTYLPPDQIDSRPQSMGKAIPNAEILVLREDGSECAPGEPGELVHRGALVALGYWNDPARTAERFKPIPGRHPQLPLAEIAVWSGDQVKKDEEGYLYFISRKDEMIKTSGYRVSPTEVEAVVYSAQLVSEAAALGLPHPQLGQAIVIVVATSQPDVASELLAHCQRELPNYMVPRQVIVTAALPRNPNGKIDRKQLASHYQDLFQETPA